MKRLGATAKVSMIIFLSRIIGYVRDMLVAAFIGAGPMSDAMMAAFKLTNLFRSIFSEGAMSAALVPTLSQSVATHGFRYSRVVASHVFSILLLILTIFTLLIFYQMKGFILITNPGFKSNSQVFELAVDLAYIMFPYLTLISIAAFYGSILQIRGGILQYPATSIIFNIVLIIALISYESVYAFAYGLLVSGVLEVLWMMWWARRYHTRLHIRKPILSKYVRKTLRRIIPGIVGASMVQISVWCDMLILSFFSGGISYLYFADRLIQLPLAIFSTATAILLLPSLSTYSKSSDEKGQIFNRAFRSTLCFILPSAGGIFLLSETILKMLFMRGAFDFTATTNTKILLQILCFALPFQAISKIYVSAVHSSGNTAVTMKFTWISVLINVGLSLSLMNVIGFACVAVASVFSSAVQMVLLMYYVQKHLGIRITTSSQRDIYRYLIATVMMIGVVFYVQTTLCNSKNFAKLLLCIMSGIITYIIALMVMKATVLQDFILRKTKKS